MLRILLKLFRFVLLKTLFLSKPRADELFPNCSIYMQIWESDKDLDYSLNCSMRDSKSQL